MDMSFDIVYIYFGNRMWSVCVEANLCMFFFSFVYTLYMYFRWRSIYQDWRVGIPLTGTTPPQLCVCPNPGYGFLMLYGVGFSWFSIKMRGEWSFLLILME
jgi:hypothetical protein